MSDSVMFLRKYVELYDQTERQIKKLENLSPKLFVPAVNQLRYAGYHIAKHILASENGTQGTEEELKKAIAHAERALYDSFSAGLIFCLEEIKRFKQDYRLVVGLIDLMPDYVTKMKKARAAAAFIEQSSDIFVKKEKDMSEAERHFDALAEIVDELDLIRPEVNKKLWVSVGAAITGFLGLALAILAAF